MLELLVLHITIAIRGQISAGHNDLLKTDCSYSMSLCFVGYVYICSWDKNGK